MVKNLQIVDANDTIANDTIKCVYLRKLLILFIVCAVYDNCNTNEFVVDVRFLQYGRYRIR